MICSSFVFIEYFFIRRNAYSIFILGHLQNRRPNLSILYHRTEIQSSSWRMNFLHWNKNFVHPFYRSFLELKMIVLYSNSSQPLSLEIMFRSNFRSVKTCNYRVFCIAQNKKKLPIWISSVKWKNKRSQNKMHIGIVTKMPYLCNIASIYSCN